LPAAGWLWETLNGVGLAALVLFLVLTWEAQTPSRRAPLQLHQAFAILVVVLTSLHAVGFLLVDAILLEHLKPSAPASMLTAIVALLVLFVLTVLSFPALRRKVWPLFSAFRRWHLGLTITALIGMLWHVIGTASVFASPVRAATLCALVMGMPVTAMLMRRHGGVPPFSREEASLAAPIRFPVIASLALLLWAVGYGWSKQP
jgi:amino acid transporter